MLKIRVMRLDSYTFIEILRNYYHSSKTNWEMSNKSMVI